MTGARALLLLLIAGIVSGCIIESGFDPASDKRFTHLFTVATTKVETYEFDTFLSKEAFEAELERGRNRTPALALLAELLEQTRPAFNHKRLFDQTVQRAIQNQPPDIMETLKKESISENLPILTSDASIIQKMIDDAYYYFASKYNIYLSNRAKNSALNLLLSCKFISYRTFNISKGSTINPDGISPAEIPSIGKCSEAIDALAIDEIGAAYNKAIEHIKKLHPGPKLRIVPPPSRTKEGEPVYGSAEMTAGRFSAELRFYRYESGAKKIFIVINKQGHIGEFVDFGNDTYAIRTRVKPSQSNDKFEMCPSAVSSEICESGKLKRPESISDFFNAHANGFYYLVGAKPSPKTPTVYYFSANSYITWEEALRRGKSAVGAASEATQKQVEQTSGAARQAARESYDTIKQDLKEGARSLLPWPFR